MCGLCRDVLSHPQLFPAAWQGSNGRSTGYLQTIGKSSMRDFHLAVFDYRRVELPKGRRHDLAKQFVWVLDLFSVQCLFNTFGN